MIGRRATVGLPLLCALLFCAFAASTASAAGTTAVTCVKSGAEEGDFTDAHCVIEAKGGEGAFDHTAIAADTLTNITLSNSNTASSTTEAKPLTFGGLLFGAQIEFSCSTVHGTGILENRETEKVMRASGNAEIAATNCNMIKPAKCTVKEPFAWDTKFVTYENGSEMGIEFTPKEGKNFGFWGMEGSECAFKGKNIAIEGSFKGTLGGTTEGKGATIEFTKESTTGLKWGGSSYVLTGAVTPRMTEGDPITFTT